MNTSLVIYDTFAALNENTTTRFCDGKRLLRLQKDESGATIRYIRLGAGLTDTNASTFALGVRRGKIFLLQTFNRAHLAVHKRSKSELRYLCARRVRGGAKNRFGGCRGGEEGNSRSSRRHALASSHDRAARFCALIICVYARNDCCLCKHSFLHTQISRIVFCLVACAQFMAEVFNKTRHRSAVECL